MVGRLRNCGRVVIDNDEGGALDVTLYLSLETTIILYMLSVSQRPSFLGYKRSRVILLQMARRRAGRHYYCVYGNISKHPITCSTSSCLLNGHLCMI